MAGSERKRGGGGGSGRVRAAVDDRAADEEDEDGEHAGGDSGRGILEGDGHPLAGAGEQARELGAEGEREEERGERVGDVEGQAAPDFDEQRGGCVARADASSCRGS